MTDYITTFFAEKDLEEQIYEVQDKRPGNGLFGTTNLIPTGMVIETIQRTKGAERQKIENILRQIDFKNGDVHHFLRHLAEGIANTY